MACSAVMAVDADVDKYLTWCIVLLLTLINTWSVVLLLSFIHDMRIVLLLQK